MTTAATSAAARQSPPRKAKAALIPPASSTSGSATAPIPAPSGIAVCRIPSASPRSATPNHCMTARPLAALTLAPAALARKSSVSSVRNSPAHPAAAARIPQAPSPVPRTTRSPTRSASRPQASSVRIVPTHRLASRTPSCDRLRSSSSRSFGARTDGPMNSAEFAVAAAVPAARTAHLYFKV
jgi:hypothetical protein